MCYILEYIHIPIQKDESQNHDLSKSVFYRTKHIYITDQKSIHITVMGKWKEN